MAELTIGSKYETYQNGGKEKYAKMKDELKLPSSMKRRVSLSDIIAATIGEEARSCDMLHNDIEPKEFTETGLHNSFHDNIDYAAVAQIPSKISTENSNNASDLFNNGFETKENDFDKDLFTNFSFSAKNIPDTENEREKYKFPPNIGFDTEMDFLSSLFTPHGKVEPWNSPKYQPGDTLPKTDPDGQSLEAANTSYDSDLEDSMHFVEPDESGVSLADGNSESPEQNSKKQRVSLHDSTSCPFPITSQDLNDGNPDIMSLFDDDLQDQAFKMHGITRTRSFSGNIKPKLSRQSGKYNLLNRNSKKTPKFGRTRSYSEACSRDNISPVGDNRFNTSLTSLLESPDSSPMSKNPFFSDLKSLLISDCSSNDCPKTLFETLSNKHKQDVYARERNLQSKFSSLQGKYPEEVRELSSFYRQQSAEVETERLKEIHDENVPISYRNHLNSYYDNQLHMIMERVDKSLSLLSTAKREIVTINRPFKSRPLLSRKAVKMMEEWFSRNYEHPYPGPTAVEALAKAGEITNEQVKKWFANKRNRCKNSKPVQEIANMKRKRQFSARW